MSSRQFRDALGSLPIPCSFQKTGMRTSGGHLQTLSFKLVTIAYALPNCNNGHNDIFTVVTSRAQLDLNPRLGFKSATKCQESKNTCLPRLSPAPSYLPSTTHHQTSVTLLHDIHPSHTIHYGIHIQFPHYRRSRTALRRSVSIQSNPILPTQSVQLTCHLTPSIRRSPLGVQNRRNRTAQWQQQ